MSAVKFWCDENLDGVFLGYLFQHEPGIDIVRVGQPGAPPLGTADPDLLVAAEAAGRTLLSFDRSTMPLHIAQHQAAGHHTCGVFILRPGYSLVDYGNEVLLIWAASEASDWSDQLEYIPWPVSG